MMQTPHKPESLNECMRERVSEQTAVEHCICAKLCAWLLSSLRTRHVIQWHFLYENGSYHFKCFPKWIMLRNS